MAAIEIRTAAEADAWIRDVRACAQESLAELNFSSDDPLDAMFKMKFIPIGRHPTGRHALNLVEQINQTWTFLCSFVACKKLLELHPALAGFWVAPGASASQPLDIMSFEEGLVGAETFAAVDPKNNKKLEKDIEKLVHRPESSKYVFFLSPKYPETQRVQLTNGVEVWSLGFDQIGIGRNQ